MRKSNLRSKVVILIDKGSAKIIENDDDVQVDFVSHSYLDEEPDDLLELDPSLDTLDFGDDLLDDFEDDSL